MHGLSRRYLLLAALALPLAGCITYPEPARYSIRYTMILRRPGRVQQASTVLAIATWNPAHGFMVSTGPGAAFVGEALRMDLPDGRVLLAPPVGTEQPGDTIAFVDVMAAAFGRRHDYTFVPPLGVRRAAGPGLPVVLFKRIDDPRSARWLDASKVEGDFGRGASLAFTFEAVRAPPTFGRLDAVSWIVRPRNPQAYIDIPDRSDTLSPLMLAEDFRRTAFDKSIRGRTELITF